MKDTPLVSVVIPTYNRGSVICRTIDNVLSQTYPSIELIIVDDGSTDDTQLRLRAYGDRIRVISQPNSGPAAARNRGIEAARGEFVALQDSDDLWVPTKLERQVALLKKVDKSVVCCVCDTLMRYTDRPEITDFQRAWVFPGYQQGLWTNPAEVLATRFVFFCQTAVIRRDILQRVGGFDETLKYQEDYELPLRLALEGPWTFINDQLTIWNQSGESWSQRAFSEEIELRKCEIRMRESILLRVRERENCAPLKRLLRLELGRTRRELWFAKLATVSVPGTRLLSNVLRTVQRYAWGIYRRTPWFPKLEGEAVTTDSVVFQHELSV
jgi:glycosyltransferase involved in cell wall biosynthesis